MLAHFALAALAATTVLGAPSSLPRDSPPVHLAVTPTCGPFSGHSTGAHMAGLAPLQNYSTIVSFGDGYLDLGVHDGSAPAPAELKGTDPKAGGRLTNGNTWVELLAEKANATLKGYAQNGTTAAEFLIKGHPDVRTQMNSFIQQLRQPLPSTLYVVSAGSVDLNYTSDVTVAQNAAGSVIYDIIMLYSYPTYGTDFLFVDNSALGDATTPAAVMFRTQVLGGMAFLKANYPGINVGYVDLAKDIWSGVLGAQPGYQAFGYTSTGSCTRDAYTTNNCCDAAETTFHWIPGFPSKDTHRIIADYIEEAMLTC